MRSTTEDTLIRECKVFVERSTLQSLQEYYQTLLQEYDWSEQTVDWAYVLQKIYLHACLKKKADMAAWLESLFQTVIDPIQQIAYRHTFAYGRALLRKSP